MSGFEKIFEQVFTITPSQVSFVIDPHRNEYADSGLSQEQLNKLATRGTNAHRQIGLEITNHKFLVKELPQHIQDFIHTYPSRTSSEITRSVQLAPNTYIRARTDHFIGNPPNCLCLENKPGKKRKSFGGLKGRYVLQAMLNGLTVSADQDYLPDTAIYMYNSKTLAILDPESIRPLLPQVRQIAISAARILGLHNQCQLLKTAGTIKKEASPGQPYLFYLDQLSSEYKSARTNIPEIRQSMIDERRNFFDPALDQFIQATKSRHIVKRCL